MLSSAWPVQPLSPASRPMLPRKHGAFTPPAARPPRRRRRPACSCRLFTMVTELPAHYRGSPAISPHSDAPCPYCSASTHFTSPLFAVPPRHNYGAMSFYRAHAHSGFTEAPLSPRTRRQPMAPAQATVAHHICPPRSIILYRPDALLSFHHTTSCHCLANTPTPAAHTRYRCCLLSSSSYVMLSLISHICHAAIHYLFNTMQRPFLASIPFHYRSYAYARVMYYIYH